MDNEPFFIFNLENINVKSKIHVIKKFIQQTFDVNEIINFAEKNKINTSIKNLLIKELSDPSDDFIKHFLNSLTDKPKTQKLIQTYKDICKSSFNSIINDLIREKLSNTLSFHNKVVTEDTVENSEGNQIITAEE